MNEVLQLFLSAPAPEKKRPYYKRDVLNICCLPPDDSISLSYRHDWLSADLSKRIDSNSLGTPKVLLIFCEEQEPAGSDIYQFYPLRFASLITVSTGGAGATFNLRLGAFCNYPDRMHHTIQVSLRHESYLHPAYPRKADEKRHEHAKFARTVNSALTIESADDAWEELIDRISKVRGLSDSLFFICTKTIGKPTPIAMLGATSTNAAHRPECTIPKGAQREMDLYVRAGKDAEFSPPEISIRDTMASVSGPFVRQFQNGFLSHYILDFRKGWDKESSLLRIGLPIDKTGANLRFRSPELNVYVMTAAADNLAYGVIGCLTAGSVLLSISPDFIGHVVTMVAYLKGEPIATPSSAMLGALSLISKTIGTALFGFGAWLGFKKLPFKT